jgi:hypothetical protein
MRAFSAAGVRFTSPPAMLTVSSRTETGIRRPPKAGTLNLAPLGGISDRADGRQVLLGRDRTPRGGSRRSAHPSRVPWLSWPPRWVAGTIRAFEDRCG